MLLRKHRLQASVDFQKVYRYGKSLSSKHFVLFFMLTSQSLRRFGFVVSKKFGSAPARHHMQRLCREAIRHNLDLVRPGVDCVLQIRHPRDTAPPGPDLWRVERELFWLLQQARLIRGEETPQACVRLSIEGGRG